MNSKRKLKKYIKKSRKLGFSIKEITDSLLATGWTQGEIRDAFLELGNNFFTKAFMALFDFILNIFSEIKKIFKGDIFILKRASYGVKKELEKETKGIKKESSFIFDKAHLLWHYFIRFVEGVLRVFDRIFSPLVRIIYLPFLIFGLNLKRKNKILKIIPKSPVFLNNSKYDFDEIAKSSGKISFFDSFRLAMEAFRIKRLRFFLIIFALSLAFAVFLFLGYFLLVFNGILAEKISENIQFFGNLPSGDLFDTLKQIEQLFYLGMAALVIFGILIILFFTLGLVNLIKVIVFERKKEINVMLLAGASKKDILRIFFAESLIMGIFGGAAGFLAAYFSAFFINYGINTAVKIYMGVSLDLFLYPLWFIDFVFIFSLILSFIIACRIKNILNRKMT